MFTIVYKFALVEHLPQLLTRRANLTYPANMRAQGCLYVFTKIPSPNLPGSTLKLYIP